MTHRVTRSAADLEETLPFLWAVEHHRDAEVGQQWSFLFIERNEHMDLLKTSSLKDAAPTAALGCLKSQFSGLISLCTIPIESVLGVSFTCRPSC